MNAWYIIHGLIFEYMKTFLSPTDHLFQPTKQIKWTYVKWTRNTKAHMVSNSGILTQLIRHHGTHILKPIYLFNGNIKDECGWSQVKYTCVAFPLGKKWISAKFWFIQFAYSHGCFTFIIKLKLIFMKIYICVQVPWVYFCITLLPYNMYLLYVYDMR